MVFALTLGALLFGGPLLIGYSLALHHFPFGYVAELILVGSFTTWSAAIILYLRHKVLLMNRRLSLLRP